MRKIFILNVFELALLPESPFQFYPSRNTNKLNKNFMHKLTHIKIFLFSFIQIGKRAIGPNEEFTFKKKYLISWIVDYFSR